MSRKSFTALVAPIFALALATPAFAGRDAGQGPQRRGGLLGGAGLSGFTGVGAGGFGQVGGFAQGAGEMVVNSSQGGVSKDTWVLEDETEEETA